MSETVETMNAIAYGEAPVLETLTAMNLDTLERSGLDLKTYMMVRIAGLVAMDAPPVSYAINAEAAIDVLELEDLQAVLVALAPVVGSARIASAAASILDVFFEDDEIDELDDDAEDLEIVALDGETEIVVVEEDGVVIVMVDGEEAELVEDDAEELAAAEDDAEEDDDAVAEADEDAEAAVALAEVDSTELAIKPAEDDAEEPPAIDADDDAEDDRELKAV
jgi:hypothetical protein